MNSRLTEGQVLIKEIDEDVSLVAIITPLEDINTIDFDSYLTDLFEILYYLKVDSDLEFRQVSGLVSKDEIIPHFNRVYQDSQYYVLGLLDDGLQG